jgi:hypothetical protein
MSNEYVLFAALALASVFFLGLGYLAARLFSERTEVSGSAPAPALRYKPLRRLFSEDDFDYLSRQPGFEPGMLRQLRKRRARVFEGYLRQMQRDFEQLHRSLRSLTARAAHDRPEIARALLEQQLMFRLTMVRAEMRLAFYRMGARPVDLGPLIDVLENMQTQVHRLSHQTAVSAARG